MKNNKKTIILVICLIVAVLAVILISVITMTPEKSVHQHMMILTINP